MEFSQWYMDTKKVRITEDIQEKAVAVRPVCKMQRDHNTYVQKYSG